MFINATFMNGTYMSTGLNKAVEHFKTKKALAEAIGVKPMTVTQWFNRGLPAHRAKQISDATGGKISLQDLVPELFEDTTAA